MHIYVFLKFITEILGNRSARFRNQKKKNIKIFKTALKEL